MLVLVATSRVKEGRVSGNSGCGKSGGDLTLWPPPAERVSSGSVNAHHVPAAELWSAAHRSAMQAGQRPGGDCQAEPEPW